MFQSDFDPDEIGLSLDRFWQDAGIAPGTRGFADRLINGVIENKAGLDGKIRGFVEHWDLNRMGAVDRNVLRIALYEMFFCPDIPPVVSINEAVDIAKRFGSDESGRFVNGVLDRAKADLSRPARDPAPASGT